jgi:hypothetical protein
VCSDAECRPDQFWYRLGEARYFHVLPRRRMQETMLDTSADPWQEPAEARLSAFKSRSGSLRLRSLQESALAFHQFIVNASTVNKALCEIYNRFGR